MIVDGPSGLDAGAEPLFEDRLSGRGNGVNNIK